MLLAASLIACSEPAVQMSTAGSETSTTETESISAAQDTSGTQEQTEEQTTDEQTEKKIFVIETTDIHGWLVDVSSGDPDTFQYRLAYIANEINEARESGEYDDVLLLDGGDLYQGPPISDMLNGNPIKAYLDVMDYDAVALGNHEFDWDVTGYCADEKGTVAPYELEEYKGDPDIPIVASGLYYADTDERVPFTKDYVMLEKAGMSIAVIGYIPDYRGSIMSSKIAPYRIDESFYRFNELVSEVNTKEDPDITVVLAHSEPQPLAEALDPGQVDLVLGGHAHKIKADTASNGIPYIEGNCKAQGYASAVIIRDTAGSVRVEDIKYTDITADKNALTDAEGNLDHLDKTVLDISYLAWNKVWEEMSEVLGYIDTPVLKGNEGNATSAGNWITGCFLRATEEFDTVAAFYNYGGIRTEFKIPSGEYTRQITIYDVYSMLPFGNLILIYELTGKELARQLELGLQNSNYGDQMSGLTFTYKAEGDKDHRTYEIISITLDDGTEIDPDDEEQTYRVAVTDYSATVSGSIFENKQPVVAQTDAPVESELIIDLLREERDKGDGYIYVDTGDRGKLVEQ